MTQEAFNSAAKLGVPKAYNNRQFSQIFAGIKENINEVAVSGGSPVIVSSGSTPPAGTVEGQIGFFENASNEYFEYAWIGGVWTRIKTQTNDVTASF